MRKPKPPKPAKARRRVNPNAAGMKEVKTVMQPPKKKKREA